MVLEKYEYLLVEPGTEAYAEYLALRHDVFCEELGRIVPDGRQVGGVAIETDEYDVHSLHVLCRIKESKLPVGCSRLILPGPKGLNVNSRYSLSLVPGVSSQQVGEIGRLALSSSLRRHRSDSARHARPAGDAAVRDGESLHAMLKREGPMVAFGLYREIFNLAGRYGITHCYAAMEPALARLLNRLGFPFREAGPLNTAVVPARQPYLVGAQAVRAGLATRNSCLYRFMVEATEEAPQRITTAAAWPVAAESRPYGDIGLHI